VSALQLLENVDFSNPYGKNGVRFEYSGAIDSIPLIKSSPFSPLKLHIRRHTAK